MQIVLNLKLKRLWTIDLILENIKLEYIPSTKTAISRKFFGNSKVIEY